MNMPRAHAADDQDTLSAPPYAAAGRSRWTVRNEKQKRHMQLLRRSQDRDNIDSARRPARARLGPPQGAPAPGAQSGAARRPPLRRAPRAAPAEARVRGGFPVCVCGGFAIFGSP
ncbi:unnamed protein product, partial [Prorocentrum cordatum]